MDLEHACRRAAEAIFSADALLIGAGAGMGVEWVPNRSEEQKQRYRNWLGQLAGKRLAIIEFGAGMSVPTVRWECESRVGQFIRVNPRDTAAPLGSIVLPLGALQAVRALERNAAC